MNWRVLIYGPSNLGVHELVKCAPKPYGIRFHEHRGPSFYEQSSVINNSEEFKRELDKFFFNGYETLILDNLGSLERFFTNAISETGSLYDLSYGVGESKLKYYMYKLLETIGTMKRNVILLAHEDQRSAPGLNDYNPIPYKVPCVHRCLTETLLNWVDAVIPCVYSYEHKDEETKPTKEIWLTGTATRMGGCVWQSTRAVDIEKPIPFNGELLFKSIENLNGNDR